VDLGLKTWVSAAVIPSLFICEQKGGGGATLRKKETEIVPIFACLLYLSALKMEETYSRGHEFSS
jgi:hypothetical protein